MEEVGDVVDVVAEAAAGGTDDFAGVGLEAFGAGGADESLRGGQEAGDKGEMGEGGDLGVGFDGGFAEDGEAGGGQVRLGVLGRGTHKPTMSSWRWSKPPGSHFMVLECYTVCGGGR